MDETRYTIDDLPRFSRWPARLLGREPWKPQVKSPEELTREYEGEKWGPYLSRALELDRPVSVEEVSGWQFPDATTPYLCANRGEFVTMSGEDAHLAYVDLVAGVLEPYAPAPALVELGCGFGNVILRLARRPAFKDAATIAVEYAQSGVKLTKLLAESQGTEVAVGLCDFTKPGVTDVPIPGRALLYTSFALACVPILPTSFLRDLAAREPSVVVHFEPCYEHWDEASLIGLMRRRYVEVNDYNRNLLTVLRELESSGEIELLSETSTVFGPNPLLPVSVVAWRPRPSAKV